MDCPEAAGNDRLVAAMAKGLIMTTQPGWAFTTLNELRIVGVEGYAEFWHRDSTIVVSDAGLKGQRLRTPAEVLGCLAKTQNTNASDATEALRRTLDPASLKEDVLAWLPSAPKSKPRKYSLSCEVWGRTSLRRDQIAELVRRVIRQAFPRWQETPTAGLRVICKADKEMAALGLQLYSNLAPSKERRGSLRPHLANSLLTLARVHEGDVVVDPFMGGGTILREACRNFGCRVCIGTEVDPNAYELAVKTVLCEENTLINEAFQALDLEILPSDLKLVSNLPFGVQFQTVPNGDLVEFLSKVRAKCTGIALLLGRQQGRLLARTIGLRTKSVLVLGQPAAIAYLS